MTCIIDFNGKFHGVTASWWCDWDGEQVFFGGEWNEVPVMLSDCKPTQEMCRDWVKTHTGEWYPLESDKERLAVGKRWRYDNDI